MRKLEDFDECAYPLACDACDAEADTMSESSNDWHKIEGTPRWLCPACWAEDRAEEGDDDAV